MILLTTIVYVAITCLYLVFMRNRWLLNPAPIFVIQQLVMFLGIAALVDARITADRVQLYVYLAALCLFVFGAVAGELFSGLTLSQMRVWWSAPIEVESNPGFNLVLAGLALVSIAVSVAYYVAVGYNMFLLGIWSIITGQGPLQDPSSLRIAAYSTDRYLAAGYVNQFKNILLPLVVSFCIARYALKHKKGDRWAAVCLLPLALVFLLGTGQRYAMFQAGFISIVFLLACLPKTKRRALVSWIVVTTIPLLLFSTLLLGRSVQSVGGASDAVSLAGGFINRFTQDNQACTVIGFRYVYDRPLQLFHGEWARGLGTLIPGHERSVDTGLANEVFAQIYGSPRGTAPVSIWGVAWYDFGFPGVALLGLSLGLFSSFLYARLLRGRKTLVRLLVYAGYSVTIGLWAVGGPDGLANDGFVAILMFGILVRLFATRQGSSLGPLHKRAGRQAPLGLSSYPPAT